MGEDIFLKLARKEVEDQREKFSFIEESYHHILNRGNGWEVYQKILAKWKKATEIGIEIDYKPEELDERFDSDYYTPNYETGLFESIVVTVCDNCGVYYIKPMLNLS